MVINIFVMRCTVQEIFEKTSFPRWQLKHNSHLHSENDPEYFPKTKLRLQIVTLRTYFFWPGSRTDTPAGNMAEKISLNT